MFKKGPFTRDKWDVLMILLGIVPWVLSLQSLVSRCHFGSACSADGEERPSVYCGATRPLLAGHHLSSLSLRCKAHASHFPILLLRCHFRNHFVSS